MAACNKKYRLHWISKGQDTKQQTLAVVNLISRVATLFKMCTFKQKNYDMQKKESMAQTKGKNQSIETVPKEADTSKLLDKNFKEAFISMFKELKQATCKDFKESMTRLSYHIEYQWRDRNYLKNWNAGVEKYNKWNIYWRGSITYLSWQKKESSNLKTVNWDCPVWGTENKKRKNAQSLRNPQNTTITHKFSNVAGFKVNIQKSATFLYISNEDSKQEINKTVPVRTA